MLVKDNKFLSPNQLKNRFGISRTNYDFYVKNGLPTYGCAGVVRHPIDEVYLWFEEHEIDIKEHQDICSAKQLRNLLGINKKTLEKWEEKGLPKYLDDSKFPATFKYNKNTVITWLKSQQNDMEA